MSHITITDYVERMNQDFHVAKWEGNGAEMRRLVQCARDAGLNQFADLLIKSI